ncbi:MAG: cation:proton antiporter [archaeon]|nr:cation:proton antiporter [Candidatus Micrarchaeota archaeon]
MLEQSIGLLSLGSLSELGILAELGIIVVFATFLAIILRFLKQPLMLAYIVAGLVIGPIGLGLITQSEHIALISELGIAFLLFTVGIESDLNKLKKIGLFVLAGGVFQVAVTALIAFIGAQLLGLDFVSSIYLGVILAFSSTVIVVKLLSDANDINTLHGRLMIGFLLVQDVLVILAIPLITSQTLAPVGIGVIIAKGILLVALAFILGRYVFSKLLSISLKQQELMYLSAVSICFVFIFISALLDFSPAVGAFLAGLSLSSISYNFELAGKIKGLRDFFVTVFFVSLGMQITPSLASFSLTYTIMLAVFMLAVVLILKPIIFAFLNLVGGYGMRNGLVTGIGLAQVSEFSFILASYGVLYGALTRDLFSIVIIVIALTMALTPYLMRYSEGIYVFLSRFSAPFTRKKHFIKKLNELEKIPEKDELNGHIVILGAGVMGSGIASALHSFIKLVVIDHDPEIIFKQINKGIPAVYGNIENDELWKKVNLSKASLLVLAVPEIAASLFLAEKARQMNPNIVIFARAKNKRDALALYDNKVDFVVITDIIGSNVFIKNVVSFLETGKVYNISNYKDEFIKYLKEETEKEENNFRL